MKEGRDPLTGSGEKTFSFNRRSESSRHLTTEQPGFLSRVRERFSSGRRKWLEPPQNLSIEAQRIWAQTTDMANNLLGRFDLKSKPFKLEEEEVRILYFALSKLFLKKFSQDQTSRSQQVVEVEGAFTECMAEKTARWKTNYRDPALRSEQDKRLKVRQASILESAFVIFNAAEKLGDDRIVEFVEHRCQEIREARSIFFGLRYMRV